MTVPFGTSAPEFAVTISAADQIKRIYLSNVIGSIFLTLVILGGTLIRRSTSKNI